jgi:hypothetical protein
VHRRMGAKRGYESFGPGAWAQVSLLMCIRLSVCFCSLLS